MAKKFVDELREKADSLYDDQNRIEKELDAIITERNWVITQARKGNLTATDLEYQLGTLTMQEINLKRELVALDQSININALKNWEDKVNEYLADLQAGIDELKIAVPQTSEEQHEIFLLKKRIVNALVERVTIDKERNLMVQIRLDLFDLESNDPDENDSTVVQDSKDGTYSHRRSSRARPRRCASYASPSPRACQSPPAARPGQ